MPAYKLKSIFYLALLNVVLAILLVTLGNFIFGHVYPVVGIMMAIIMFFFYELFVIMFTENKGKTLSARQSVNLILGVKTGKIILSLLFVAIYAAAVNIEMKRFIMVFLALYFIYLLFDTFYLTSREKDIKAKELEGQL